MLLLLAFTANPGISKHNATISSTESVSLTQARPRSKLKAAASIVPVIAKMAKFNVCTLSTVVLALSSLPCAESFSRVSGVGHSWRLQHKRRVATSVGVGLETDEILQQQKKYIVVTGGVISGIGKGVTASSIGVLLKMLNLRPTAIKIDPYLNVDAGTMSPFEHGEVFVLDDGSETDLDLGNYERFLDVRLTNDSNLTTGKVYQTVVAKERKGEYLGKTVQIIPHVTNEIMARITRCRPRPCRSP